MKRVYKINGFTLIELLVAVSVLGVLGIVITSVLVQSLKGEKKVQVLNQTKQNAQVVLERIIKDVQGASYIYCVGDKNPDLSGNNFNFDSIPTHSFDTLVLVNADSVSGLNTYNRYRFIDEVPLTSPGPANGYISFDTSTDTAGVPQAPLSCDPTDPVGPTAQSLTDTDKVNGISLTFDAYASDPATFTNHVFYDNSNPSSPDSVTIRFRANAGVSSQALFNTSEQQNGQNGIGFGSTTTVRNGSI